MLLAFYKWKDYSELKLYPPLPAATFFTIARVEPSRDGRFAVSPYDAQTLHG